MTTSRYKAVIFDRDGTLNKTTQILRAGQQHGDPTDGYVLHPDELELLPSATLALMYLRQNDVLPFVFTQQNCIHKGLLTADGGHAIHARMNELLGAGVEVEAFYVATSPTDPRAKPSPQIIHDILRDYDLQPDEVVVMGDSLRDCHAAKAAGVDFVWIRDDLKRVAEADMQATGYQVFDDVLSAITTCVLR